LIEQIKAVERECNAMFVPTAKSDEALALQSPPAMLMALKGIGPEFAAVLWSEGLFRSFANRPLVGITHSVRPECSESPDRLETTQTEFLARTALRPKTRAHDLAARKLAPPHALAKGRR